MLVVMSHLQNDLFIHLFMCFCVSACTHVGTCVCVCKPEENVRRYFYHSLLVLPSQGLSLIQSSCFLRWAESQPAPETPPLLLTLHLLDLGSQGYLGCSACYVGDGA